MSVTDVTARISQIQAQLALLPSSSASSVGASAFSTALARTSATAGTTLTGGTTGGTTGGSGAVTGDAIVAKAKEMLGLPYVWGGTDPQRGVDCSGLVQSAYAAFGIELPRLSADQARAGRPVASMNDVRPGDLIAWDNSSRNNGADHIAIYAGNGQMIEAPRPGGKVQLVPVTTPPDYIRRVLPDAATVSPVSATMPTATSGTARTVPAGTPYAELFQQAASVHGLDPALLVAVARQESGFDPQAVSPAGAQGLMQLMPGTAAGLGVTNPFDPAQSIGGAAQMLGTLLGRFGSTELALAAYNAGPGAVLRYDGIPPYPETQNYVRSIMTQLGAAA